MKQHITQVEFQEISDKSRVATMILNDPDFKFIRDYISEAVSSIEKSILNGTIHDVTEDVTITHSTRKQFFTSKEEQLSEIRGQYKWITKFLTDIQFYADLLSSLEAEIAKKNVIVEGQNAKDIDE